MTNVLIVEDDDWLAELWQKTLKSNQFEVKKVTNAIDAINSIDQHVPDVLILDMMLPGTNAMTLIHELVSHQDTQKIAVIVCSSLPVKKLESLKHYGVMAVLDKSTMSSSDLIYWINKANHA